MNLLGSFGSNPLAARMPRIAANSRSLRSTLGCEAPRLQRSSALALTKTGKGLSMLLEIIAACRSLRHRVGLSCIGDADADDKDEAVYVCVRMVTVLCCLLRFISEIDVGQAAGTCACKFDRELIRYSTRS